MNIIILSHFCGDCSKSDNGRFLYIAKTLSLDGHDVEIITSNFYHTTKKHRDRLTTEWPFKITFLPEPGYTKNICLKRFYSHYVWGKQVEKYLKKCKKPDVLYCAVPSLTAPYIAAKYCEKNDIRFIIDIQDLWPEAFRMIVNIPIISSACFAPFKFLANSIYSRANAICSVSDTYCQRALQVNKKCEKAITVFLGTNLDTFDRYVKENPVPHKRPEEIWIAYCGTLGASYNLSSVIDAISLLKQPVKFIVMGDGPQRDKLEKYAKKKEIHAEFTGYLPYDKMCGLLSACDIAVNPIAHGAAQSIINKHADYAAAGLPIVSTQENEEYKKLIDKYQMGFNCEYDNINVLSAKFEKLVTDFKLRKRMGEKSRQCAEENFDRKKSYVIINNLIK